MKILQALLFSSHIAKPTHTHRASLRSMDSNKTDLFDSSFSRYLLNRIVNSLSHVYEPYNAGSENTDNTRNTQQSKSLKQAIEELNSCSDTELHDLGISRGEIRHAILHGRYGIEYGRPEDKRSAA